MKTLILKVIFTAIIMFGLNGCYTIIWSPDSEFPTQDNSVTNIYYGDNYYGDYYYFYDTPWWWDITPPTLITRPVRDESTQPIRDLGGRQPSPRVPPIINTAPPSRDGNTGSTGTNGSTGNNGSSTETTVRNSSSSSSGSSGRESSSSSGSTVRNNNGGRSSGGRK